MPQALRRVHVAVLWVHVYHAGPVANYNFSHLVLATTEVPTEIKRQSNSLKEKKLNIVASSLYPTSAQTITTGENLTAGAPKRLTAGARGCAGDHHAGGNILPPAHNPCAPGVNDRKSVV